MSSGTPTDTTAVEIVSIDNLRETGGARFAEIDSNHVSDLADSIELEGLIEPIIVVSSSSEEYTYDIVDGRHRKRALEELDAQNIAVYTMPGDRDYAVPTREAEVDVEIQSMAANVLRKEQTQAEKARFLKDNIESRIIDKFTDEERIKLGNDSNTDYADARVTQVQQLLDHLENVESDKVEWKYSEKYYHEITRILTATDCAAKTASEYIRFYVDSPQDVVEMWKQDEVRKGAVKHLRQIDQNNLRGHALKRSKADGNSGYSTRDLRKVRKIASQNAPRVHEQLVSGEFSLDKAAKQAKKGEKQEDNPEDGEPEDDVDEDEFEQFKQQLKENDYWKRVKTVADWTDNEKTDIAKDCYRKSSQGKDYQQELDDAVTEINDKKRERKQLRSDRVDSYGFDKTPFKQSNEDGSTPHKEAPLVLNEAGYSLDDADGFNIDDIEVAVFFHDNIQMGLEAPDSLTFEEIEGFFHLLFFSPPYFDQSGTMPIDQWLPEGTNSITDERTLDATYENYLDWMLERINMFARKLKPGRALIINVSDISTSNLSDLDSERFGSAPEKRYNIPADLCTRVRESVDDLQYDSTIQWMRQQTTSQRGGQYWSNSGSTESGHESESENQPESGYPLYYYPQDVTEELLIFRKNGKPNHSKVREEAMSRFNKEFSDEAEFQMQVGPEDPTQPFNDCLDELVGEFDDPRNNVWKIAPQSDGISHEAAFPQVLARLVIQLFTLPGERVADPFGGYATTLRAVQELNANQPEQPDRQGFAWENFSSEQVGQEDYPQQIYDVLSEKGLAEFRQQI